MRVIYSISCLFLATGCHLLVETGDSSRFKPDEPDYELTLRDAAPEPRDGGQMVAADSANLDATAPGDDASGSTDASSGADASGTADGSANSDAQSTDAQPTQDLAVSIADMTVEVDAAMSVPCEINADCRDDGEICGESALCEERTCVNCSPELQCVYGCCQDRRQMDTPEGACTRARELTLGIEDAILNPNSPRSHLGSCTTQRVEEDSLRSESFFSFSPPRDGRYCFQVKPHRVLNQIRRESMWVVLRLGCCTDAETEFACETSNAVTLYPRIERVLHEGVTYTIGIGMGNPPDAVRYEVRAGACSCETNQECDAGFACNAEGLCENRAGIDCELSEDCGRLQDCIDGRCG